ncbi:hypothetical protein HanRHA438_Chr16g0778671 [Helianthus annuus]|nr:hypothetical protein HanRHA438_Chr16g0778671 [Helianthus annuus]
MSNAMDLKKAARVSWDANKTRQSPLEQILDRGNEHTSRSLITSARQVLKGDSVFWLMDDFLFYNVMLTNFMSFVTCRRI